MAVEETQDDITEADEETPEPETQADPDETGDQPAEEGEAGARRGSWRVPLCCTPSRSLITSTGSGTAKAALAVGLAMRDLDQGKFDL